MSWCIDDSDRLYNVSRWGRGMFSINDSGHLQVHLRSASDTPIDLHGLTEELQEAEVDLPLLLRFPQVAERRVRTLQEAIQRAAEVYGYDGAYRPVYPIKVNQQAHLVEYLTSSDVGVGLEAGSKPELVAAIALLAGRAGKDNGNLLICNGYKDTSYVRLALDAQTLGLKTLIVVEKLSEVDTILAEATRRGVRPLLGVRARLSRPGAGRWRKSSGDKAKFGLSAAGTLAFVETLKERGYLDCLKLLHFHIGSQVSDIRTFKRALREGTRLYVELARFGAPMGMFDVGGGLGVDYDGSKTTFDSSMNYTLDEYAEDVISAIHGAVEAAQLPAPDLVTESGRSTIAHSSVLLLNVVGVEHVQTHEGPYEADDSDSELVKDMGDMLDNITQKNVQGQWLEARDIRERARQAFELGVTSLETLGRVEQLYWSVAKRAARCVAHMTRKPEELEDLEVVLADTYYANFSLFQSLPDVWAIGQLFPILPIHRLHEEPTVRAIIADLTCDSDGRLDRFIDLRDVRPVLEVHPTRKGESYILAVCLVGAYQEILGDLHNLFGDTHAVHVVQTDKGPKVTRVIDGDTVTSVLKFVQYERKELIHRIRTAADAAIERGVTRNTAARVVASYRAALDSYTYLDDRS
ncbi:MAG: biosynthetic arginine decarboxylase [Myxococcota bacterium]